MDLTESIVKNNKPFYPTEADVICWFNKINSCIFDDQLTPFENITIKRTHNAWAWVMPHFEKNTTFSLRMHMKFPDKFHFINVLAHEMVHKWQMEINQDSGNHNKHFYSWRQTFAEHGLNLNRKA